MVQESSRVDRTALDGRGLFLGGMLATVLITLMLAVAGLAIALVNLSSTIKPEANPAPARPAEPTSTPPTPAPPTPAPAKEAEPVPPAAATDQAAPAAPVNSGRPQAVLICFEGREADGAESLLPMGSGTPIGGRLVLSRAWSFAGFSEEELVLFRNSFRVIVGDQVRRVTHCEFHPQFPITSIRAAYETFREATRAGDGEKAAKAFDNLDHDAISRSDVIILVTEGDLLPAFPLDEQWRASETKSRGTVLGFGTLPDSNPREGFSASASPTSVEISLAPWEGEDVPVIEGTLGPLGDGAPLLDDAGRVLGMVRLQRDPKNPREIKRVHPVTPIHEMLDFIEKMTSENKAK